MITSVGHVALDITKVSSAASGTVLAPESFEGRLSGARGAHAAGPESRRVDPRNPGPFEPGDANASSDSDAEDDRDRNRDGDRDRDTSVHSDRDRDEILGYSARSCTDSGKAREGTGAQNQLASPGNLAASQDTAPRQGLHRAHAGGVNENTGPSAPPLEQGEGQPQGAERQAGPAKGHGGLPPEPVASSQGGHQTQAQFDSLGQEVRPVAEANGKTGRNPTGSAPVGYRTVSAATLAAAEAARDSVIKQIVLELGPDGGRMRMHLSPPELGRLDIHMTVEKGAVLQLSIAAERPEVLMMLDRHIPELRLALAQQGLDLSGADVQTSLFEHREHGDRSSARHGDDLTMDHQEREVALKERHVGYVTAEGLDFWV